jgi:hypothetical protein
MRRLLISAAVGAIILGVGYSDSPSVHAVQYNTQIFLLHPTGYDGTPASNAQLMCGWHDNCDGDFSDVSDIGLDWQNTSASGSSGIFVRLLGYIPGGPSSNTWVGRAYTFAQQFPCKRVRTEVLRVAWDRVGSIVQNHSQGLSNHYWNIFAKSGAGVKNASSVGYYIPYGQDNCPSSYDHVMQWYESGPVDTAWVKNFGTPNDMPHESECFHCATQWPPWYTYEYYFRFNTSP